MTLFLVALAGFIAGFMNVLAGGGSFLTLPALVAHGLTALSANASSTVALFPAQAMTAVMAGRDLVLPDEAGAINMKTLSLISLVGGLVGALLLLATPPGVFVQIVPWLVLFATVVFARGEAITRGAMGVRLGSRGIYAIQSVISIYGGYFGGGIGILMLAALTIFGLTDLRMMTSIKLVLAMFMNIAAVVTFMLVGLINWPATLVVCVSSIAGSILGMGAARRVPSHYVRGFIVMVGVVLASGFFLRQILS